MKREIIFRGKDIETGEWVYGFLYHYLDDNSCYIEFTDENGDDIGCRADPETVGQYTGLKDKNGIKIFEGDILSCQVYTNTDERENYSVYFDNGMFLLKDPKEPMSIILIENVKFFDCEVIGNIYDNYELLEE